MPLDLQSVIDEIREALELRNTARDQAIRRSRMLIRYCANSIRAMHRGDYTQAHELLQTAREAAQQMVDDVAGHPSVYGAGYTQDALKEFVEACAVYALLRREPIPSPDDLGVEVDYPAYLGGLAEAASELRRAILDTIRRGNLERGETLIEDMEDVYVAMTTIDFPDAVTGGLRRKTDALRAVLERTRGDLTVTVQQERLRQALRDFEARVERGAEG
jgi:translin